MLVVNSCGSAEERPRDAQWRVMEDERTHGSQEGAKAGEGLRIILPQTKQKGFRGWIFSV